MTAGIIIGLCCCIYENCPNKIVGAFLFGIGLCTICEFKLPLFTGIVGSSNDIKHLAIILIKNVAGMTIFKLITFFPFLFQGICCGMLMQIGVAMYRKPYITVMCVAAFILSGFKHCIAMTYYGVSWSLLVIILGNIIGAKIIYYGLKAEGKA